jgi:hypothetical protein
MPGSIKAPKREEMSLDDWWFESEVESIKREREKLERNGNGVELQRVICFCAEGVVNGKRVAVHRPSDCIYTAARSALIFQAAEIATQKIGDPVGDSLHGCRWTAAFVSAMNRLCHNAGLIG